MADHIAEEEQLEAFKRWWNENGRSLVIGILVAVIAYFGWQGWQSQQVKAKETSSLLFEDLLQVAIVSPGQELTEDDKLRFIDIATQLKTEHSGSLYASNAAFFLAKLYVQEGDTVKASSELEWVLDRKVSEGVTLTAQLRLAQVKYAEADYSGALAVIENVDAKTFAPVFNELRGDILVEQKEFVAARTAYQAAIDGLLAGMSKRKDILQMKLDGVPAQASAMAATEADS